MADRVDRSQTLERVLNREYDDDDIALVVSLRCFDDVREKLVSTLSNLPSEEYIGGSADETPPLCVSIHSALCHCLCTLTYISV